MADAPAPASEPAVSEPAAPAEPTGSSQPGSAPPGSQPPAQPEPSTEPAPATEPAPVDLDGDLPDGDTFPRSHVESLRKEAGSWRTKYREAEPVAEVFKDLGPDDREALLDLNRTLLKDPQGEGAKELLRFGRALAGENFDDVLKSLDEPQYLTPEEMEKRLEQREQAAREKAESEKALREVEAKADEFGYEDGSPERAMLFWYASRETEGDLDKANERLQAYRQGIIDSHVQGVREKNAGHPPVSSRASEAPAGGNPSEGPKNFTDARAAAEARLARAVGR